MKKLKTLMIVAAYCLAIGGCASKLDAPAQNEGTATEVKSTDRANKSKEESGEIKGAKEYSYSDLAEMSDKFWDLWAEETGKLSDAEYYGTSSNEEEKYEHYLKIATEIANRIAEENESIPVGEKVVVTGYIKSVSELDKNGFFVRHGGGAILFFLKHNAEDDGYNNFSCTTNEEIFLDLEDNTPVKIEATFLKPDIIGSNNDLYDCKIIEYGESK